VKSGVQPINFKLTSVLYKQNILIHIHIIFVMLLYFISKKNVFERKMLIYIIMIFLFYLIGTMTLKYFYKRRGKKEVDTKVVGNGCSSITALKINYSTSFS
jgi:positive regulator of sigma E activity